MARALAIDIAPVAWFGLNADRPALCCWFAWHPAPARPSQALAVQWQGSEHET